MADLKLARLPERLPVKMTIALSPELNKALADYARVYEETYGAKETPADLIPAMLETFLAGDRAFARIRKERTSG